MDELLTELEKTNADLAAKFRSAIATELDTHKGAATAAEKKLKLLEKERDKLKADADAGTKSTDERVTAAEKARAEAQKASEALTADIAALRLRHAVERKLGLGDDAWSRRAVNAFIDDYATDVQLDDKGALVGADKAIEAFKTTEPGWFVAAEVESKPGGQRAGAGAPPAKPAGGKASEPKTYEDRVAARKAEMIARREANKGGKPATH